MIASAGPLVSVASVLSRSIRGCDLLGLLVDEGVPVRRTLHEGIANLRVGGQPEGVVDDGVGDLLTDNLRFEKLELSSGTPGPGRGTEARWN